MAYSRDVQYTDQPVWQYYLLYLLLGYIAYQVLSVFA